MKQYKMISDRLPFFRMEKNLMFFKDGSLGAGFRIAGFDLSCASPQSINHFCAQMESLLVGIPEGIRMQLFYRLNNSADRIITQHAEISGQRDLTYAPIREARMEFLSRKLRNQEFFVPEIYFFIRGEPANANRRRFWQPKTEYANQSHTLFNGMQAKFEILISQVESTLNSASLTPRRVNQCEWMNLCFDYLNLGRSEDLGRPSLRTSERPLEPSLVEQLAFTDISVSENHLRIGKRYFRSISLGLLPEGETTASMITSLSSLPFHFWISQNIVTLKQRKEIEKLELSRRIAHSMASGSQNVSDIESESKYSDVEGLLNELMTGSEKLISSDLNVIYWADSESELEGKTEEILRAFRSMNQAEGLVETFALEDSYFKAMPSSCEGFRQKRMKTSNCAHLMPLFSGWTGNHRPVVLLSNREGTPFSIDPFAQELPNWNGLVFGGSGAGKSFTISQLMLQFCGQHPKSKIVWIDNGASSEKLIEVMDGEFIDLNLNSGIVLNMFDLEAGEEKPGASKIKLILGCLELILKDEEKPGLPKRDKALIEEAIFACYQEVKSPTLTTLRGVLKCHSVPEMKKYADILYSWTGDSAYGRMLDGASTVRLNKDLVSIEVKGLDHHRDLKDIFLLLLTNYIKQEAARDLARPYLLIIDEAHRLFLTPSGKDFAIESYRVFRKYNAGIFCISQNYRDFLADRELADALMPNTTSVFILRQRKINWQDFAETFDFNDAQVEAVKSLEIVKGKYSEFFFMQDEHQAVVRLEPEPLSYWICTTDGHDKAKVEELRLKYPDKPLIEILQQLAKGVESEKFK